MPLRKWLAVAAILGASVATAAPAFLPSGVAVRLPAPKGIAAVSANSAFAPLNRSQVVPPVVLGSLPIPKGATPTSTKNLDQGAGYFDRSVSFTTPLANSTLYAFFPAQLQMHHWSVISLSKTAAGGREILAKRPAPDGDYWEAAVLLPPRPGHSFTLVLRRLHEPM